jgi:hypothetical protein
MGEIEDKEHFFLNCSSYKPAHGKKELDSFSF